MEQPTSWDSRKVKALLVDGMRAGGRQARAERTLGPASHESSAASRLVLADIRAVADEILARADDPDADASAILGSFLQVAVLMGATLVSEDRKRADSEVDADVQAWLQLQLLAWATIEAMGGSNITVSDAAEYRVRTIAVMTGTTSQ